MTGGKDHRRIIAVDFDGTLAKTRFPVIVEPIPKTIRYCKRRKAEGAVLILWTCRHGKDLRDAVDWCADQGLLFDYVNESAKENIMHYGGMDTRKVFAHEYIDDKAVNPVRETMWKRGIRRLYAERIISAAGLAAAMVIVIETVLMIAKCFL